jgi:hypothetical protein
MKMFRIVRIGGSPKLCGTTLLQRIEVWKAD